MKKETFHIGPRILHSAVKTTGNFKRNADGSGVPEMPKLFEDNRKLDNRNLDKENPGRKADGSGVPSLPSCPFTKGGR